MPEPISREARPKLAGKAQLRFDRKENRYMLLYPEKGLALNATAADIVRLCNGENSVIEIVAILSQKYSQDEKIIEQQALELLQALADRALVEMN